MHVVVQYIRIELNHAIRLYPDPGVVVEQAFGKRQVKPGTIKLLITTTSSNPWNLILLRSLTHKILSIQYLNMNCESWPNFKS